MAKLIEIAGYSPGRETPVGDMLLLGRDPGEGGLAVANREASRKHARIRRQGSEYVIEDLNSANGTYINGVRKPFSALPEGTLLTVGRTTFRFTLELHKPAAPSQPAVVLKLDARSPAGREAAAVEMIEAAEDEDMSLGEVTLAREAFSPRSTAPGGAPAQNLLHLWNDVGATHDRRQSVPPPPGVPTLPGRGTANGASPSLPALPQSSLPISPAPPAPAVAALVSPAPAPVSPPPAPSSANPAHSAARPPDKQRAPVWNMMLDARATRMGQSLTLEPENLQRERDILQILTEISRTIGSILHLPSLVHQILLKAFELFPAAENASLHLLDRDGKLEPLAARSRSGGEITAPPISQTIANMALTDRQAVLSTDAAGDERFLNKQSVIINRVRSFMCTPLLFQEEVLGVLYVDTTDARPRFTGDDLRLFTAVSAQMAVAVKNSQLMADNLREAELRLHITRYLPPGLVEQVLTKQIDLNPGGSLYEGTVLFSDIVGFTPMAERLGPVQLVTTLNRYFQHMVDVIFRYNGSINKFGGDAIMALWGVPVKLGDDSLKATCAALEMQVAIFGFNLAAPDEAEPLRVGIGLNTGNFVMGNVGSVQHMEYTALGNHVNLAQRVESQASGCQSFLSENTFSPIEKELSVFELPPKLLKGVRVPMSIYSVRAARYKEVTLCAVPGMVQWSTGMTALAMIAKLFEDGSFEVWMSRRPEPGAELQLRLDPPEYPGMAVVGMQVLSSETLHEFTADSTRLGWRARAKFMGSTPAVLVTGSRHTPREGFEYLERG